MATIKGIYNLIKQDQLKGIKISVMDQAIIDACEAALNRLQVDYLDLYFCHRPDPDTPIEETVRAMHTLIMQGKICYWGTSEWSAKDIECAFSVSRELGLTPPTMEQPEYNLSLIHI